MEIRKNFIIFIIILTGIFFRFYQINYEDFWIDEIFSFWIADPKISFFETFERHYSIEQIPILFNIIAKSSFKCLFVPGLNQYASSCHDPPLYTLV